MSSLPLVLLVVVLFVVIVLCVHAVANYSPVKEDETSKGPPPGSDPTAFCLLVQVAATAGIIWALWKMVR